MTADIHSKVSEDHPRRLRRIILGLSAIYVMTFIGGFLQATPFNFINYILFFLLSMGGIFLIRVTRKSEISAMTKWGLSLTGISTTLLFIFFIVYEFFRLNGNEESAGSIEGLLYLFTLFFWILVIVSLFLIRRLRARGVSLS